MNAYCNKELQIFRESKTIAGEHILITNSNNVEHVSSDMIEVTNKRKFNAYNYQSIGENFEIIFHKESSFHIMNNNPVDCICNLKNKYIEQIIFEEKNEDFVFKKFKDKSIYFILSNIGPKKSNQHIKLIKLRKAINGQ